MAAFEDRDATTPPPTDALLFTGSSSIRMWDLPGSWPNHKTINNGFGGSTLPDVIARFDRLVRPYDARAVIIYSGDNDIKTGQSAAEVIASVRAFHALAAAAKPGVPVIFIAVKPSTARWNLWPVMKEVKRSDGVDGRGNWPIFTMRTSPPKCSPKTAKLPARSGSKKTDSTLASWVTPGGPLS